MFALPGTIDSSLIYLHAVIVHGGPHDVFVMTTTYGKTLASTPPAGGSCGCSCRPATVPTPAATRSRPAPRARTPIAGTCTRPPPDGHIYKLAIADGREGRGAGWPVAITRLPAREKITGAINLTGSHVIAATGGYVGDQPPYQGHVVVIDRSSGPQSSPAGCSTYMTRVAH